jgi:hypothetical protein
MVDASIYSLQKPLPPPINPMEVAGQAMQLQNAQQTQQINAERLKQEQMQSADAERANQEHAAATELLPSLYEQSGRDWGKAYDALAQSGRVRPESVFKMKKGWSDLNESLAKADVAKVDLLFKQSEAIGRAITSTLEYPEDQQATAWAEKSAPLAQMGIPVAQWKGAGAMRADAIDSLTVKDAADLRLRQEAAKRDEAKRKEEAQAAADLHNQRGIENTGKQREQDAAALALAAEQQGPEGLAMAIAQLPGDRRRPFLQVKPASKPDDIRRMGLSIDARLDNQRQDATSAEQKRHNEAIEKHQKAMEDRQRKEQAGDSALVDAIMQDPSIFDRLTPTQIGANAAALQARGFAGFGKNPSEGAMSKMAETRSAILSLKDLRETLKENEQYIGPISGLQALNPWSEAKTAQAKIDLVKQRVGKALEGGVLRKEDEAKYKKILATLRDTPATAIAKTDGLIAELERDLETFITEQRRGGRKVAGEAPAAAGGLKPGQVVNGYRYKGGDPNAETSWESAKK